MGEPVSYKISPGENVLPFSHSDSVVNKRAGFMNKHLWVTQFNEKELYASGLSSTAFWRRWITKMDTVKKRC